MSVDRELSVAIRHRVHSGLTIDAAFTVGPELGVLTGPSGAGKTTLLRLIAGLELPDEGMIRAGNVVLTNRSRRVQLKLRDRRVGYVFQHDVLFPHLDVADNLRYGLRGRSRTEIKARVGEVADLFGIGALLDRQINTLSGGERQRVGLARAVAPRPRVLLCDEPVSALDLDARYLLLTRLREIQRIESIPVLLVTHALDEAIAFGDRLFLLDQGRVVASGTPDEVLTDRPGRSFFAATGWRNVFAGVVASHHPEAQSSTIRLAGGPNLVAPAVAQPVGARVFVRVNSDEIVLARGPIGTLSAQNILDGTIERLIAHGPAVEVAVRVDTLVWLVGIIGATVPTFDLKVGDEVKLIIKARSCRPFADGATTPDRV